MLKKNNRHSVRAAKPVAQFTLSLEDRRKFVAFVEILFAIDDRLKKAKKAKKKEADTEYSLEDGPINLVFIGRCFILLLLIKQHVLIGDAYDRYHCLDTQQRYVSHNATRAVCTISSLDE